MGRRTDGDYEVQKYPFSTRTEIFVTITNSPRCGSTHVTSQTRVVQRETIADLRTATKKSNSPKDCSAPGVTNFPMKQEH